MYGDTDNTESGQRTEVDFGREGSDEGHEVHYVGLGVPYAFLSATGSRVLDIAFDIAARLQWRVNDPQTGRYIGEADRGRALAVQTAGARATDQIADPSVKAERGFLGRVLERIVRQTKFMILVAILAFGLTSVYAGRETGSQRRQRSATIFECPARLSAELQSATPRGQTVEGRLQVRLGKA